MFYLDASVVVAAVTEEPDSRSIREWVRAREDKLTVSSWTLAEVASALSIKVRTRQIAVADRLISSRQVERMRNTFLLNAPIDEAHFYAARRFAERHESGLRGGDALHAAIAADYDLALVTMDKGLAAGAGFVGIEVVLLPEDLGD